MASTFLQKFLEGTELSLEEERTVLKAILREDPAELRTICQLLAKQRRTLENTLAAEREARARAQATAEKLCAPPWFPATVLRVGSDGRVDVLTGGRRQVVATAPGVDPCALVPGEEVFLNGESVLIARSEGSARAGLVGTVSEAANGGVLVRGVGDEEMLALCSSQLEGKLRPGDRVVYTREFPYVVERLSENTQSRFALEVPPPVTFAEIGGLDCLIGELRSDLDLHLLHADRVRDFRLRLLRGVLLAGPPGVGKTLVAKALANYLARARGETRFLHVPPGALRGIYYGESEARIRELFAVARRAPGIVVLFMDELDGFGTRGVGIGQEIDGRVLGALLSELDGLESRSGILCIGSTNRVDLIDPALLRAGRFGDRIYQVPRPGREATRQILGVYLTADLPYAGARDGRAEAAAMIEVAVSYLHAPHGGAGVIATVTLASGDQHEILPAAVLSGALLASAVERAKHVAAFRHLEAGGGLALEDLLAALDEALTAEARKLAAPHAARRVLEIERAEEIVRVELPPGRRIPRHRYLRAA